ncbi:hypothetical protein E8E11_007573 [Didymella keratinophila]|nr:hypothetical protein E8E11_007573 [Didymella keratinophila]
MPDNSLGIKINNSGGFNCTFRVKSNGKQTESSSKKLMSQTATWTYEELIAAGFRDGDSCWVSCDIEAGVTNHESGNNFILDLNAGEALTYFIWGTTLNPSWDGPKEWPPKFAVSTFNDGLFLGKTRIKTSGKETNQGRLLGKGDFSKWTYDELLSFGFKEGDSCWVSIDIEAGKTNHESGRNFDLHKGGAEVWYTVTGGAQNPSWD